MLIFQSGWPPHLNSIRICRLSMGEAQWFAVIVVVTGNEEIFGLVGLSYDF